MAIKLFIVFELLVLAGAVILNEVTVFIGSRGGYNAQD